MTVHAAAVAAHLIDRAVVCNEQFSNMKLQKLVVLAQSLHLYRYGTPLIAEPVQAWKNGPVVKPLYGLYKEHRERPIPAVADIWKSQQEIPDESREVVDNIWAQFHAMSAAQLWKLTHEYGPWAAVYHDGVSDIQIPDDDLQRAWREYKFGARRILGGKSLPRVEVNLNVEAAEEIVSGRDVIGIGQTGFESVEAFDLAATQFTPSRFINSGN